MIIGDSPLDYKSYERGIPSEVYALEQWR